MRGKFIISGPVKNVMQFIEGRIRAHDMITDSWHKVIVREQGNLVICNFTEWMGLNKELVLNTGYGRGTITKVIDEWLVHDGKALITLPMISDWRSFVLANVAKAQLEFLYKIHFDMWQE